jgi:elongation factor G
MSIEKHLIEAVAEYDDELMEKFFEDEDSITRRDLHVLSVQQLVMDMSLSAYDVWFCI